MRELDLTPKGPGPKRKITAADINIGRGMGGPKGLLLDESPEGDAVANRLFRAPNPANAPISYGKYTDLGLFEEGATQDGNRVIRYKKGVARPYNNKAIKDNVLKEFSSQNPGDKLVFDYAYGGELETINPNIEL